MASYTGGGDGRGYTITLYMDELSTDAAANTSYIHAYVYLNASYQYFSNWTGSGNFQINGSVVQYYGGKYSMSGTNTSILIGDWYGTVGHQNADGTGSVSVYSTFTIPGGASYTPNNTTASYTFGLSNIDRSAGAPSSCSAVSIPGTGIKVSIGSSVSYITPFNYYVSYQSSSDGGLTYSSWSAETTIASTTSPLEYTYSSLTPGLTYKFRVRAYNGVDNYSAYKESNAVFLVAGGKRNTDGTNWALTVGNVKRYNGTTWTSLGTLKRFDGTNWQNLS